MGFDKNRRPISIPAARITKIAAASSHGSAVQWNAITTIAANTSAGSVVTQNTLSPNFKPGDRAVVGATVPTSSAGIALRLPATSAFFEGSTGASDSILFSYSLKAVEIVALSSTRFLAIGATTDQFAAST